MNVKNKNKNKAYEPAHILVNLKMKISTFYTALQFINTFISTNAKFSK